MKKIRVGIVGGGIIAKTHVEAMRHVYGVDVDIAGVTDVMAEKGRAFAQRHGIAFFNCIDDLLPQVDSIDICTPPYTHAEIIIKAAQAGKHVSCEKPLTGYAPRQDDPDFKGESAPKQPMLDAVRETLQDIRKAVTDCGVQFAYFENFVYCPHMLKEVEILRSTDAQILRLMGEEAHSGNPAKYSSHWKYACGGSLISTGSHPIGGILYLKRMEGIFRNGKPIRPATVSARTHALTRIGDYHDQGFLRNDYFDVEDGTVGDIIAGATVLGGVNDYVDVFANNHRSRLNISTSNVMEAYNPGTKGFDSFYINDCLSTDKGWLKLPMDPNLMFGYQMEMQDALYSFSNGTRPASDLGLATDTTMTIYAAYLSAERKGAEVNIEHI